jgi:hypothetical protein
VTLADGLAANVHLLRPIRVLLVSRDLRFLSLVRFLLKRDHFAVATTPVLDEMLDWVQEGADVVVIDATGVLPRAAKAVAELDALYPEASVIVVGDDPGPPRHAFAIRPKWLELEDLSWEIERAYLGLDRIDMRELG